MIISEKDSEFIGLLSRRGNLKDEISNLISSLRKDGKTLELLGEFLQKNAANIRMEDDGSFRFPIAAYAYQAKYEVSNIEDIRIRISDLQQKASELNQITESLKEKGLGDFIQQQ